MDILANLLIILLCAALTVAVEYLRQRVMNAKVERVKQAVATKRQLAELAVLFVQQAYKDLDGPKKYLKAVEWLAGRLIEHGIRTSPGEVKGLVEAVLKEVKAQFGEGWKA